MRKPLILILVAAAVVLAGCAPASDSPPSITVGGHGEVAVAPDVVTVTLGVQTNDREVTTAVAENNAIAAAILQAARDAGVADADMQTSYFSVYPQREYDSFGQVTGGITFFVDNNLTVKLRQVDRLSELLQGAVDAGAANIYGVSYSISDSSDEAAAAQASAMADAEARAEQIAAELGLTLGEPITISTGTFLPPPSPFYYGEAAFGVGGGGGPPVSAGTSLVVVNVTVSYAFR
ncbi:MAG TPA: SIMPL domain-containing protein [Anaerolineales bacterium]|nr:SIMPL domain-containing protein [Anaerolineales bacterium]